MDSKSDGNDSKVHKSTTSTRWHELTTLHYTIGRMTSLVFM